MMFNLLLETSGRGGLVGLARGGCVVQSATLDEPRRHVRDLAATVRRLCDAEHIAPQSLDGVVVGIGPGSYTGLRVGLAAAKAFAYALDCPLIAVPTFNAVVESVSDDVDQVEIVADALNGLIYRQRFERIEGWKAMDELEIVSVSEWDWRTPEAVVLAASFSVPIPREVRLLPPTLDGIWAGSRRMKPLTPEELFAMEPLYLRGSSAEEKRKAQSVASDSSAS